MQTQMARQVVTHKVREAERERQYEEFKDRVGEIVNGTVKRVEYGNVIVDLGRGEGIMRRDQSIPRENFQIGDRIRSYIYDVRTETKGPPDHAEPRPRRLHGQVVRPGSAGSVRRGHRDPRRGPRPRVARQDGRGLQRQLHRPGRRLRRHAGLAGSRAVVAELQGEKIDIIQWSPDEAAFIVNALAPAEVTKVVLDEEEERVEVVVPDEQLSLANWQERSERASGQAS